MKRLLLSLLALCVLAGACERESQEHDSHGGHEAHGEHEDEHEEERGAIVLHDEEIAEFGIAFTKAGPTAIRREISLPGEVQPNADRLAHIVPRYPGIVREVRKRIGDEVKRGETLAVIESNEALTRYEMHSLIDGVVLDRHITLGEVLHGDVSAFLVADLSAVWIDLAVYSKDLSHVRKGQRVRLHAGVNHPEGEGVIAYVSPAVREDTRTALARIELPNSEGRWRPGLFVTAHVAIDEQEVPVGVPLSALMEVGGENVVFVRDDHGIEVRDVETGARDDKQIEIRSGLRSGESVASAGVLLLKAELEKGALEDAGHDH